MSSKKPTDEVSTETKLPRHVAISIRHLVAQRENAIAIRDKADGEVKRLDAALAALGWKE